MAVCALKGPFPFIPPVDYARTTLAQQLEWSLLNCSDHKKGLEDSQRNSRSTHSLPTCFVLPNREPLESYGNPLQRILYPIYYALCSRVTPDHPGIVQRPKEQTPVKIPITRGQR